MKNNIALVGFMATGKTTVGKALAERLGLAFIDSDEVIEKRHKKSIAEIFADNGEEFFRSQETLILQELCSNGAKVIATGGGAVLRRENIDNLLSGAHVIRLTASPQVILERTDVDASRPLLQSADRLGKIKELMQHREQYYAQAEHTINTDEWDIKRILGEIEIFLHKNGWQWPDESGAKDE